MNMDELRITGIVNQSSDKNHIGQISLTVQSINQNGNSIFSGKHLFLVLQQNFLSLKALVESRAANSLSADAFALFTSLLFGERNFFRGNLKINIAHLHLASFVALNAYAVSVLEVLLFTQPKFFVPRRLWGFFLVPCVFTLFVFSHFSIVLLRVLVSTTFFAFGIFFRQHISTRFIFYSSVALLLLINPFFIYNLSFQFSVVTLFGIFLWQPLVQKVFFKVKWLRKKTLGATIVKKGLQICSVSLAAQSFTLPLIFYHFGEYDLASFVAHIVLFFFISVLVIVNFGYALVIFASPLDTVFASFVDTISLIFANQVGFLAQFSGIIVWRLNFSVLEVLIWWLGAFFIWFSAKSLLFSRKPSF